MYLLDSNVCIVYLNGRSVVVQEKVRNELSNIVVCSVVKSELFYGALRTQNPQRTLVRQQIFLNQFVSLPFDDLAVMVCAQIRAQLASRGTPIGSNDLQIAAIALTHHLTLVTHNVREFSRVDGLQIEDWE